jgi:hypothetical protein
MPRERFMSGFFCLFINTAKPKEGLREDQKTSWGHPKSAKSGKKSHGRSPKIFLSGFPLQACSVSTYSVFTRK